MAIIWGSLGEVRLINKEETDSRSNGGKKQIIKVKADANYIPRVGCRTYMIHVNPIMPL